MTTRARVGSAHWSCAKRAACLAMAWARRRRGGDIERSGSQLSRLVGWVRRGLGRGLKAIASVGMGRERQASLRPKIRRRRRRCGGR